MVTIQFTEDFATKKKGDIMTCDGMLAAQLIGGDKVAKVYEPELHTITEQDLELNPGLEEEVSVGEVVELGPQLTAEEVAQLEADAGAEEEQEEEASVDATPATEEEKEEEVEEAPAETTPEPTTEAPIPPAKSKKKGKQS